METIAPLNAAVQRCVRHMLSRVPGVKVLIVDYATTGILSVVASQSEILGNEVFLVRNILSSTKPAQSSAEESTKHLNVVYFVRPDAENILALIRELKRPNFNNYYLYFTSQLEDRQLERLARSDVAQRVSEIRSFFCDFVAVGPETFSLELPTCHPLMFPDTLQYSAYETALLTRICSGVASLMFNACNTPFIGIRFPAGSDVCRCIATQLQDYIAQHEPALAGSCPVFNTMRSGSGGCLVLLFDRRDDPVTPLLNQWTYQAMTHELIGIERNTVTLKSPATTSTQSEHPGVSSLVLSPYSDPFFAAHRTATFGVLGPAVGAYVKEFQAKSKTTVAGGASGDIADMKTFLENYPEFRRLSGNVSQHVQLVHELSQLVEARQLLTSGVLEQEIACMSKKQEHFTAILRYIEQCMQQAVPKYEVLRLSLLFALRYEGDPLVQKLREALLPAGVDTSLLDSVIDYGGAKLRQSDLFDTKSIFQMAKDVVQRVQGNAGNNNVYMQHQSYLTGVVDSILRGKLKVPQYAQIPFQQGVALGTHRPSELIVFVVGGATFQESAELTKLSQQMQKPIYIGGTTIHNSKSFLAEAALTRRHAQTPQSLPPPPPRADVRFGVADEPQQLSNGRTHQLSGGSGGSGDADLEFKRKFLLEGW